jgi:hypothetical protein
MVLQRRRADQGSDRSRKQESRTGRRKVALDGNAYTLGAAAILVVLALSLTQSSTALAQSDPKDQTFARLQDTEKKLGPKAIVSGGARALFYEADNWTSWKTESGDTNAQSTTESAGNQPAVLTAGQISAPTDFAPLHPSRLRGFTSNESSAAWCGNNVVVGFNSVVNCCKTPFSIGGVIIGYSTSSDKGATFTDRGFPPPTADPSSNLGFDQVATCTSASNFYLSSLYNNATETAVSVSTSADGGQTFGPPAIVASTSSTTHFFDGDWMAVNPANPQQLFVTYTDDDTSLTVCPTALGTSIKLVSSNDGGITWSNPVPVTTESCTDTLGFIEFSDVAVDPRGTKVYVTWEFFGPVNGPFLGREVDIASAAIPSTPSPAPLSLSFGSPVKVSSINYAGTYDAPQFGPFNGSPFVQLLQGRVMGGEHPELAIGKGPTNTGMLYVTWNDGANRIVDVHSLIGNYQFTDVVVTSSGDGGITWSKPVRVNDNTEDGSSHPFSDQFHPTIATDNSGKIAICFYDRRNDPLNFLIGRTCAVSTNGTKWKNIAIDSKGSPSVVNQDDFGLPDWLGDYEVLTADSLNQGPGFIGGYTNTSPGYQNVRRNKIQTGENDDGNLDTSGGGAGDPN